MIKNIVFDMGGVLLSYDPDLVLDNNNILDESDREFMKKEVFGSLEWQEDDRGTVTKDSFNRFVDIAPGHLKSFIRRLLIDECFGEMQMPVFEWMDEFIGQLKAAGYKIYLLSNAGQDFYQYSKKITALRHFDGKFVSSDYKLLKPEKEIYEKFLEVFDLVPEECVFIDDVQRNIDAAVECGMYGICYTSQNSDSSELRTELEKAGVKF